MGSSNWILIWTSIGTSTAPELGKVNVTWGGLESIGGVDNPGIVGLVGLREGSWSFPSKFMG